MPRDICYFDGQCGMCRRTTRILQSLDWLDRLRFSDMTTLPEDQLPVPLEQAMQGMPMRTREGRSLSGFPAVRRALLQTPLGFLVSLILYLPGLSILGAHAYRWVATHRRRDHACRTDRADGAL